MVRLFIFAYHFTKAKKKTDDYDLLLSDTRNDHQTASKDHESLLSGFFHGENDGISDHSSNTFSPNNKIENKRPRVMQWGPQDGQEESTIVSVVLEHTEETGPMKLVFGSITVETAQQQHTIPSISNNHSSVWITLAASVPLLSDTMSETNQTQLSVCAFDRTDPDVAIDTWNIGKFTYRDISEGLLFKSELNRKKKRERERKDLHCLLSGTYVLFFPLTILEAQSRKRALSNEPDEISQKKTAYDIKQGNTAI